MTLLSMSLTMMWVVGAIFNIARGQAPSGTTAAPVLDPAAMRAAREAFECTHAFFGLATSKLRWRTLGISSVGLDAELCRIRPLEPLGLC
jgi:hypothetical protein